MKIGFWNTGKLRGKIKNDYSILVETIQQLLVEQEIDILFLAEGGKSLQAALANSSLICSYHTNGSHPIIMINFTRIYLRECQTTDLPLPLIEIFFDTNRIRSMYVYPVHIPRTENKQVEFIEKIYTKLQEFSRTNNNNIMIIGDLNINPFDLPNADEKDNAKIPTIFSYALWKGKANLLYGDSKHHPILYNPSMNLFADSSINIEGKFKSKSSLTYYHRKAKHSERLENVLDQALLFPGLIDFFVPGSLHAIEKAGNVKFWHEISGMIQSRISDHLPITITFKD